MPYQVAGTEVYTSLLSKYLHQQGIIVKVVIPNYGASGNALYVHEYIPVIAYAEPSEVDRSLIMGLRKPDGLKYFEELLVQEQPNIVHFHELAGSNGVTVHHVERAKALGFKVVTTLHLARYTCKTGNLLYENKSLCDGVIDIEKCTRCNFVVKGLSNFRINALLPLSWIAYKLNINLTKSDSSLSTAIGFPFLIDKIKTDLQRLYNSSDKVVTLTSWYKTVLQSNRVPRDKIVHIPQALPFLEEIITSTTSVEARLPIRLMYIGRISPIKGVHLLLEAVKGLPCDKIILHIYGQEMGDAYSASCREQSVGLPNVKWMGKIDPNSVVKTMQKYQAVCIPSVCSEMSPLVIQEAFAAAVPVIASDVHGNSEQITHNKNGLLFKFNNSDALKYELQCIIENPELLVTLGKNIQPPQNFNVVGMAYLELYQELLRT
ncbi:glycosyltransferase [Microvirga sp. STS03]|nr:glycosyltransferase [Microvirga sp. STS03]